VVFAFGEVLAWGIMMDGLSAKAVSASAVATVYVSAVAVAATSGPKVTAGVPTKELEESVFSPACASATPQRLRSWCMRGPSVV